MLAFGPEAVIKQLSMNQLKTAEMGSAIQKNFLQIWKIFIGACLIAISVLATGGDLALARRSPQETFQNDGVVSLLQAAKNNDAKEARRLIGEGVDVNTMGKDGATPLIWMLSLQDLSAMRFLLELGADPNQFMVNGVGSPLWLAAAGGKMETLRLLLDYKADPNLAFGTKTPLVMAVIGSHLDCAELLLLHGADINRAVPISALEGAMSTAQFDNALWVLNHGYTLDLPMARRMLEMKRPRPGQEELQIEALAIVDRLLAEKK